MTQNTTPKQQDNTLALLVGVGDYTHPRFAALPATVRDVQAIAALLADPARCGYPSDKVQVLTGPDATASNIRAALESLAQSTNSQSTVFLYFSGHGGRSLKDGLWRTYLCPREANPDHLDRTAISGDEFKALLAAIPARRLLVILDACHAAGVAEVKAADGTVVWKAGLPSDYYEVLSQGTGRVIIASSKEDQFSYVRSQGDLSLFTHHLLQALGGAAAVRGDGVIRVLDVFHYVSEAVQADEPKQIPVLETRNLDLNFAIALDQQRKGSSSTPSTAQMEAIREQIVRDPIAGARALSSCLTTRSEWATKRNEVDLKRAQLEQIQHDLDLLGPNPSDQAAKNRVVYYLLQACLELERAEGAAASIHKGLQEETTSPFNPQQRAVWHQRLGDLVDNIAKALDLLKEYEDALLFEDDPRRRARYTREIERLRVSVARYRSEYDELKASAVGELLPALHDLDAQLRQANSRLDRLSSESSSEPPQIEALPRITSNVPLEDLEKSILQHVYADCEEVFVEKEFGGGFGGARVLLNLPVLASDGLQAARKVTKLGPAPELRRERDRFKRYVGPRLSFYVARVEGETYYEQDDWAGLNYVFLGGKVLEQSVTLEEAYRKACPDAAEQIVETLNGLLDTNLGTMWYGMARPLACFFAAEYGRHLVEHLRLQVRLESSDGLWRAGHAPQLQGTTNYGQIDADAIPHEYENIRRGRLLEIKGLILTQIVRDVAILEDPNRQGIVVRVDLTKSDANQRAEWNKVEWDRPVTVRGKVVHNRKGQTRKIVRAIFRDPPNLNEELIQLPCGPGKPPSPAYPNPLKLYPKVLGTILEGRKSYVHGDMNLRNVLVDKDGKGKGWLIDFAMVEERHNLFDFIKLETYLRLGALGGDDLAFSLCDYVRFEEALASAILDKEASPPEDPHLRCAYDVLYAVRRIARKYMGPEPDFRNEYFPSLLLYSLAVTKHYRNIGARAARQAFATACVMGKYMTGADDQSAIPARTPPSPPHPDQRPVSTRKPAETRAVEPQQQNETGTSQVSTVDATPVESFDIAVVRHRLTVAFDDPALNAFCMDYFPDVYDKFSRGMRKDEKITLLLDYCRRLPARRQKLIAKLEEVAQ